MIRRLIELSVRCRPPSSTEILNTANDRIAHRPATVADGVLRLVRKNGTLVLAAAAFCTALVEEMVQAFAMQVRMQPPTLALSPAVVSTNRDDPCARLTRQGRDVCIAESIVGRAPARLKARGAALNTRRANYAGERLARRGTAPATR